MGRRSFVRRPSDMFKRKRRQSVFDEPQMRPDAARADASEHKADRTLGREGRRARAGYDSQSVFDEPDVLPGRASETLAQDWSCSVCGYNLRGLPTGHACPECGNIEPYRPPPVGAKSYHAWLRERLAAVSFGSTWSRTTFVASVGAMWCVLVGAGTSLAATPVVNGTPLVFALVFLPIVEEIMKLLGPTLIVETRPYWFRNETQILTASLVSAFAFAVGANAVYFLVFARGAPVWLLLWRWVGCAAIHLATTRVAAQGLIGVWRRCVGELRPPQLATAYPLLVTAVVIRVFHNALNIGVELAR